MALHSEISTPLGQVSLAGYIRNSRGVPFNRLRVYGRYALVYLLEGSGRMLSGKSPVQKCRAGDLLFVYPEIPHAYGPGPGENWSEFYVVFEGPVFDLWRRAGLLQPNRPVQRLSRISHWLPRLEATTDPALPNTSCGMLRRVCRLQKFLSDIAREAAPQPNPLPWLELAMRRLVDEPEISPHAIARALGLSYETFRKEFSRHAGQPPARFRLHRLIDQARVLIQERNLNNKQVAETLGFYDEFHFSRHFRRITGQSPRQFRGTLG